MAATPTPVNSELRFAWRVDYFATPEDAVAFFEAKREAGFQAHSPNMPSDTGKYAGLYGVHWKDRPGEGWY